MAYNDPYAGRNHYQNYGNQPEFDPYYNTQPQHGTYDQAGYEPYTGGYRDDAGSSTVPGSRGFQSKEASVFEDHGVAKGPKSSADLRRWRLDHQGNLWTKGGRGRCVGRFCCCILLVAFLLIVSIFLSLALWIRPPNITIADVGPPANGSEIQVENDGMQINLAVNISVANPNFFTVYFNKIDAQIFYPINNTRVGNGNAANIQFDSHSTRTFDFPFSIIYSKSADPNNAVLIDLATKCGFIGGQKTDISVNYQLTLGIRVLFLPINPVISNKFTFACPISEDEISKLMPGGTIPTSGLGSLLSSL